jgi:hypothetical protein
MHFVFLNILASVSLFLLIFVLGSCNNTFVGAVFICLLVFTIYLSTYHVRLDHDLNIILVGQSTDF